MSTQDTVVQRIWESSNKFLVSRKVISIKKSYMNSFVVDCEFIAS